MTADDLWDETCDDCGVVARCDQFIDVVVKVIRHEDSVELVEKVVCRACFRKTHP